MSGPGPQFGGAPEYGGGPPSKSGGNPALIIGIVVLVVGLVAAGAFLLLSGDDEKEGENASSRDNPEQPADDNNQPCGDVGSSEEMSSPDQDSGSEDQGDGQEGENQGEGEGCAPPEVDIPTAETEVTVPEVEVPDIPEVDVDPPSSSGDVQTEFAEIIYEETPEGVSESDALCLANAVITVVGEDLVVEWDYVPDDIFGDTDPEEDEAIAMLAWDCTSGEADAALEEEVGGFWPDEWNPRSS